MRRRTWIRILAVAAGGGLGWLWSWWQTCNGST